MVDWHTDKGAEIRTCLVQAVATNEMCVPKHLGERLSPAYDEKETGCFPFLFLFTCFPTFLEGNKGFSTSSHGLYQAQQRHQRKLAACSPSIRRLDLLE